MTFNGSQDHSLCKTFSWFADIKRSSWPRMERIVVLCVTDETLVSLFSTCSGLGHCGALRNPYEMWTRVVSKEMEGWAHRLLDIGNNETRHGIEAVQHQSVAAPVDDGVGRDLRSALTTRNLSLAVRSGISRLFGFPSKSAYFAFWKKLFLFDVVANVARVGGSLFLYVFAPHLYQSLPGGLIG
ncbi:Uncharacterized protein APZ42_025632 [Daphnia magna]|uniref:Uncharacterized protein n=1 Tax=Daphnia magna TaxID=35525 RepID=A0A0P4X8F1_9CRUS|nr:Uncharacterized protein APZ42_025632 [Daphnia magna]